ncbi:hypothetical protein NIES2101_30320 [Calothrix sp. HK-06]|nr:hypothetical protein NIES2101_30320 [Calothrix sp. HK-06]
MSEKLFDGNSEMAGLMRSLDWSQTPLGIPEQWAQSLKTSIRIMLGSRYPMFVWWGETLTNFYNDDYIPVLGQRHPWALGQPASQVWAEIWDTLGPQAEAVLRSGEASWNEAVLLIMERNGYTEETYFTFSYSPVPNDDGGIGGVFCACTEETRRVLSDRRLQTLRSLAAQIITAKTVKDVCEISVQALANNPHDVSFALLYLLDETLTKARLVSTTGLVPSSASPIEIDIQADEVNGHWELASVLATGESRLIEQVESKESANCGGVWSESSRMAAVLPLTTGEQSQITGFLIAGISPRREFDDDYKGFFDLVAGQIATALTNAQAYEAERQRAEALAELDRAKTAFFSNVSHEFRTPLTLMLAPLEDTITNLDGTIPDQELEQLQLVQRNGIRLLKLVNSLLDFSRIEAGRVEAVYEPIDLATYTAELASTFRSLIERAGISLIVDCPPLPSSVYVDSEMWEKIVLNLLSNAFKFTLAGSITVRLQSFGNQVKLLVIDTGVGIRHSELPHLFERFYRVENSQGRSFEGSGIGLSLVQELVKLHGGAINVTSTFGQGSCFTVTIPTTGASKPPEYVNNTTPTLASTKLGAIPYVEEAQRWFLGESTELNMLSAEIEDRTRHAPTAKILLADDNADMRDYIQRLLKGSYTVEAVADGVAALAAIKNDSPDLVLTDVMMPGINGFELLRALRSNPQTQAIPIILLSARAGEETRIEGLTAGADDYLIKPFSGRELLARVEATLKLSQLRQEAQQKTEAAFRRINQLLESMSEAFIAVDFDWRITYQNATAERINNKLRCYVLGKTLWEGWPAAVSSISEQQYRHALAQQVPVHFEQHYYEPPDHDVWLEVHAYPYEDGLGIFYRDISARRQIEQALRSSEEQTRSILSSIAEAFFALDENWRFTYVNRSAGELLDVTPEDLIGKNFWEEYPGLSSNELAQVYWSAMRDRVPASLTAFYPDDGRWYEVRTYPASNGITVYFNNVTNQKQAEEISRKIAELNVFRISLADALRPLADPVEIQATASRVLGEYLGANRVAYFEVRGADYVVERDYVNAASAIAGNYPIDSFGLKLLAAYRTGHAVFSSDVQADANLSPQEREAYKAIEIGAYIGVPLVKEGEFVAGLAVHTSRSRAWTPDEVFLAEEVAERTWAAVERARAEVALRDSENRFRMAIEAAQLGTWDWNLITNELILDEGYKTIFGLPPSSSNSIEVFFAGMHPTELERIQQLVQIALNPASEGKYDVEYRIIGIQDKVERWVAAKGQVYFDYAGNPQRFIGTVLNITEQKRIEVVREQFLAREQAAREAADRANQIKDEFLAVLSHELRTPLNPILGWSKLLQQGKLDAPKTKTALATIERNAKLQVQLIDDLLDISRILRGKLTLTVVPVDLSTVIIAALETVRLAAEAKAIQIQTNVLPNIGIVMGDGGRLQQVVWNILSNAVKFTPQGGQVTINLTSDNNHAQIQVTDTGKGISADFLPYVFEHFRQEDGATTRKFGGLGLGLAIVRQIVEMHGGMVAVNSLGEEKGATFIVKIPLASQLSVLPVIEAPFDDSENLNGIRIFVTDDEPDSRDFIAFVLEQAGASITTFASGIEALQAISKALPDLIVSDIGMPEMDGYMFIQQIRSLPLDIGGKTPAIALTAYAGEVDQKQALLSGFQSHISKPVEPAELVQAVLGVLKNCSIGTNQPNLI